MPNEMPTVRRVGSESLRPNGRSANESVGYPRNTCAGRVKSSWLQFCRLKFWIARMSKVSGRDERRCLPALLTMLEEVQEAVLIFSEDIQTVEFPLQLVSF